MNTLAFCSLHWPWPHPLAPPLPPACGTWSRATGWSCSTTTATPRPRSPPLSSSTLMTSPSCSLDQVVTEQHTIHVFLHTIHVFLHTICVFLHTIHVPSVYSCILFVCSCMYYPCILAYCLCSCILFMCSYILFVCSCILFMYCPCILAYCLCILAYCLCVLVPIAQMTGQCTCGGTLPQRRRTANLPWSLPGGLSPTCCQPPEVRQSFEGELVLYPDILSVWV